MMDLTNKRSCVTMVVNIEKEDEVNIGDTFNRWEVIGLADPAQSGGKRWKCRCVCGEARDVSHGHLVSGNSKSCGCLRTEVTIERSTKHGRRKDPIYYIWRSMIDRCTNVSDISYCNYGAKGISVCARWTEHAPQGFLNFLEDMGEIPEGMSIDRIDPRGNYCHENCRWATSTEQNYNQKKKKSNKTGKTGVWYAKDRNKYIAYISKDKKRILLGQYENIEDAIKVRLDAELEYYGYNKEDT